MIRPTLRPVLSALPGALDVVILGGGAAGIAAARRLRADGLTAGIVEARGRIGGRLVTASLRGHPVDLGAHWLHAGMLNPLVRLAAARRERLFPSPGRGELIIDGRRADAARRRAHALGFQRMDDAISDAAEEEDDSPISAVMPPLGPWTRPIATTFALLSGRPLDEVSAHDYPSEEFGDNYFVSGGYGRFVAGLASGLPVVLSTPATTVDWSGEGVRVETARGTIRARAAIVTLPVPVLQRRVRFTPALPDATAAAIAAFRPGIYEHVVLNWPSAPFRQRDRLAKVIRGGRSFGLLTRIDGAPFHYLELDYAAVHGTRAVEERARLARAFLRGSFGAAATRDLRTLHVTDWLGDPHAGGSWAVIPPGHAGARAALAEPVGDRVWFAGEATSRALWGTAGGAWEEGERAALAIAAGWQT